MSDICVVGSINLDFFTLANRFPKVGETIFGESFFTQPGGKGANQAIAAAKLGANVSFIGALGNDDIQKALLNNFKEFKVDTSGIEIVDTNSGVAQITIAENDNMIIVVPGANHYVDIEVVKKHIHLIDEAQIVLLQLEIPLSTLEFVVDYAYEKNKMIILNPAPSAKLSKNVLEKCTLITPNEIEIEEVFNDTMFNVLKQYPNKVIMTKGSEGVFYHDGVSLVHVEAKKVDIKDTTGAGDTFNGALATALRNGLTLYESVSFANTAAAMSIRRHGAQQAMPTRKEVEEFGEK